MGGNSSQSFDKFKRAFLDLVNELHARKLAIPAGAVLAAILAAVFLLPKAPAPPPPATTAPVAELTKADDTEAVVSLRVVGVTSLDDTTPIANSSDPFKGSSKTVCVRVGKGTPKKFLCKIGDLLITYTCLEGVETGICGEKAGSTSTTGSTASTGGSGATGGGTGGSTGSTGKPKTKPKPTTYYVVNVSVDGRTYKNVIAGDGLPNDKNVLAIFAGVTDSAKKAIFIAGDGVTVTGATVDEELGNFELTKGQSVTIVDKLSASHTLTLKSIVKVTK